MPILHLATYPNLGFSALSATLASHWQYSRICLAASSHVHLWHTIMMPPGLFRAWCGSVHVVLVVLLVVVVAVHWSWGLAHLMSVYAFLVLMVLVVSMPGSWGLTLLMSIHAFRRSHTRCLHRVMIVSGMQICTVLWLTWGMPKLRGSCQGHGAFPFLCANMPP